jgi:hypothetical protein
MSESKPISVFKSVNEGLVIVCQKDLLDEVEERCESRHKSDGGPNEVLAELGWNTEYVFSIVGN